VRRLLRHESRRRIPQHPRPGLPGLIREYYYSVFVGEGLVIEVTLPPRLYAAPSPTVFPAKAGIQLIKFNYFFAFAYYFVSRN